MALYHCNGWLYKSEGDTIAQLRGLAPYGWYSLISNGNCLPYGCRWIFLQNVLLADLTEANFALVENLNLVGTERPDTLTGGIGNDTVQGLGSDDVLSGGFGADTIFGGTGDDFIFGDEGDDTLNGGEDNDTLTGGTGADSFLFDGAFGNDTVTDYDDGIDLLDLSGTDLSFTDFPSPLPVPTPLSRMVWVIRLL